jgi:hypothetical protein
MSDSTSDTSAIDDKNNETNSSNNSNYFSNVGNFVLTVLILFIMIVVYYASSGLILYACKMGQANILPTDVHCYPYEETKPNIQPIQTNIFTTFTDPEMSMKMKFPYNDFNSANKILDMFREYKHEPRSNFLANYFISIMENVIQFNYSAFNAILNAMNSYLPEVVIVLFGPILVGILSTLIFLVDHLYLIYLWFANMGWFFKTNTNSTGTGNPQWEDVGFASPFDYWCAVCLVILFVILFFFSLPLLSIIAIIAMSWCMFSCMTYKAEMNGKNITALPIIQDIFKYYKLPIMAIFSFFIIVSAFSKLGTVPGIFSIITLLLIYFGTISIDIFNPISKDNLSPSVSYDQAKKTCSFKEPMKEKHGLLYDILFGGQKGGQLTKELKNIGKRLSRK